jgi:CDP-2,3-bis-(O-geranylgeranyl)-sn-glycerol synthase
MLHATVVQGLWFIFPAYASNVLATLVGGGPPIDGGRNWSDGRRVLGDGKTWRGLILAPLLALAVGALQHAYAADVGFGVTDFGEGPIHLVPVYALALGALLGDVGASFLKRRLGKQRGSRWLGPDQYDFVAGALLLAALASLATMAATGSFWLTEALTWGPLLVILILTPGLHLLVNGIGYLIGVKEVPW